MDNSFAIFVFIFAILGAFLFVSLQYLWYFVVSGRRLVGGRKRSLPDPCGYFGTILYDAENFEYAELFVHSTCPFRISIRRGTRDAGVVWQSAEFPPHYQLGKYNFRHGLSWVHPVSIPITALDAGAYIVVIEPCGGGADSFRCPLLIRRKWKRLVVVSPTNTWHAYNNFGGLSNYYFRGLPFPLSVAVRLLKGLNLHLSLTDAIRIPSIPLPFCRPLLCIHEDLADFDSGELAPMSHLFRGELNLLQALDRLGVDYCLATDEDIESGRVLSANPSLVIFNTHSEYWSEAGLGVLRGLLGGQTSVAFFSGNNIYRRVEREASRLCVVDQRIDVDFVAGVIGAGYDALGYKSYAGYRVCAVGHWAMKGVTRFTWDGCFGRSGGCAARNGASGWETDKVRRSTTDFTILAVGTNPEGPAFMVCRDFSSGNFIFNAASVSFTSAFPGDKACMEILRNLLDRAGVFTSQVLSAKGYGSAVDQEADLALQSTVAEAHAVAESKPRFASGDAEQA